MRWECISVKDGNINDTEVFKIRQVEEDKTMWEIKKEHEERERRHLKRMLEIINGDDNQHSNRR